MGDHCALPTGTACTRRAFVATGGALAGLAAASGALGSPLFALGQSAPADRDAGAAETAVSGEEGVREVWGHCAINCPGRCSLKFHVKDGEVLWVDTYAVDPTNIDEPQPRACLRGRSYRRWMNDPGRINYPLRRVPGTRRGDGEYERISWDEALQITADNMKRIYETYGPEAVYSNYATGVSAVTARPFNRLLNLMGGYLGYYGNYSAAQYGWIAPYMFGGTPGSTISAAIDADLILVFGSSPVETRQGGAVSNHDWARMREKTAGKIINFDPRMNDSVMGHSSEWQPINPGTDAALVSAIAHELIVNDLCDLEFLHTYCVGFDEETMPEGARGQKKSYTAYIMGTGYDLVEKTPEWAEPITGIGAGRIRELAQMVGNAKALYVVQGWGTQRRCNGEMQVLSICMLPLLTGNIGLPGTNTGLREGNNAVALVGLPVGENPVKTQISVFSMVDAIERGTQMTEAADGVKGRDRLAVPIKMVINYAGNCITNQNADINHVHDVMADESLCEFVLGSDIVMTDSLKYSDIILPDLFRFEQVSMIGAGGDDGYVIAGQPCTEPKFERRTNYEALADLAEKLGLRKEFTQGMTEEEWQQNLYETSREKNPDLPAYDDLMEQGVFIRPGKPKVALADFRADPQANPLSTPSGKIEIYSEELDTYIRTHEFAADEFVAPVPVYQTAWNGPETRTDEYPLVLSDFHYRGRLHSSWGNVGILKELNPQELWINPADAEERGISQGDTVRCTNELGAIELLAKVTPRVVPGTVAAAQGAWHSADMDGDRVDRGGCTNTLASLRPSPLCKGNCEKNILCEVARV